MSICEPVRTFGDQHRAGFRERLQTRSQIRGLANNPLLLGRAFAGQVADNHHAGSNPNANL